MTHQKMLLHDRFTKQQQKYRTLLQRHELLISDLRQLDKIITALNPTEWLKQGPFLTAQEQYGLQAQKQALRLAYTKLDNHVTPLENDLAKVLGLATREINGKIYRLIHPGYFDLFSGSIFILNKIIPDQLFQELRPMSVSESSYYRQHHQHYWFLVNTAEYERNLADQIQTIQLQVIETNRLLSEIDQSLQQIQWQELQQEKELILLRIKENEPKYEQAQQGIERMKRYLKWLAISN